MNYATRTLTASGAKRITALMICGIIGLLTSHLNTASAADLQRTIKCSNPLISPVSLCESSEPIDDQPVIPDLPPGIGAPLSDLLNAADHEVAADETSTDQVLASAVASEDSYDLPSRYYTHGVIDCEDNVCQVRIPIIPTLFPGFLSTSSVEISQDLLEYYTSQGGEALFGQPLSPQLQDGYLIRYDDIYLKFSSTYQVFQSGIIYINTDGTVEHAPVGTWLYAKDMIEGHTRDTKAGVLIGTVRSSGGIFVGKTRPDSLFPVADADDSEFPVVKDIEIKATSSSQQISTAVTTDVFGEFLLKVAPGTYALSVNGHSYQPLIGSWQAIGGQVHMTDFLLTIAPSGEQPEVIIIQPDTLPPVLSGLANTIILVVAALALFGFVGAVILGLMSRSKKVRRSSSTR